MVIGGLLRAYLLICVSILLTFPAYLLANNPGSPSNELLAAKPPQSQVELIVQEIRYHAPEAGKVVFVWGADGWGPVPEAVRPAGTVIHKNVMFTPMTHVDGVFSVLVHVPKGLTVDFVFRIVATKHGEPVLVSDLNGDPPQDYHILAGNKKVVEILASPTVMDAVIAAEKELTWLGAIVLAAFLSLSLIALWKGICFIRHHNLWAWSNFAQNKRFLLGNSGLLILCLLITATIAVTFVSNEKIVHCWDNAAYQDETMSRLLYFNEQPLNTLYGIGRASLGIWESFGTTYSHLHVLPIIPLVHIFGDSRLVYILSLTFLYFLPFVLVLGLIAAKMVPNNSLAAFWIAVFVTLFTMPVWLSTLNGFPDAAAAAMIGAAVWLYLRAPRLRSWRQMLLIAFCIVMAILFRRHFVYSGLAFFLALALQTSFSFVIRLRQGSQDAFREFWQKTLRICLTGLCTLAVLSTLGWPFLKLIFTEDYLQLYASYEAPVLSVIRHYHDYYGLISLTIALAGLVIAFRKNIISRQVSCFIVSMSGSALGLWLMLSKQLGYHYTLHFNLAIMAGLVASFLAMWQLLRGKKRLVVMATTAIFLIFNMFIGMWPVDILGAHPLTTGMGFRSFFADRYPPLQRNDLEQLNDLVNYLQKEVPAEAPIYVAASSELFNDDLLWHIQRNLHEDVRSYAFSEFWHSRNLNFLHWTPFYDSGGVYPLEWLLLSDYVVVTNPIQYHMAPEQQDVVTVVNAAFREGWEFANDFERLPVTFSVADTVEVIIYKRARPTSLATALRTFASIKAFVPERPGAQTSWVNITDFFHPKWVFVSRGEENSHDISINLKTSELSLLYIDEVPGQVEISGEVSYYDDDLITDLAMRIKAVDENGEILASRDLWKSNDSEAGFSTILNATQAAYLILTISANCGTCLDSEYWCIINNLKISKQADDSNEKAETSGFTALDRLIN